MITIDLLSRFLNQILGNLDYKQVEDEVILNLVKVLDPESRIWHVNGKCIWRSLAWRKDCERQVELKKRMREYADKIDKRKETLEILTLKVMEFFNLTDRDIAFGLAHSMIINKSIGKAIMMGVDIRGLPELEKPHLIIVGNNKYIPL
jgi:hypothetical protein